MLKATIVDGPHQLWRLGEQIQMETEYLDEDALWPVGADSQRLDVWLNYRPLDKRLLTEVQSTELRQWVERVNRLSPIPQGRMPFGLPWPRLVLRFQYENGEAQEFFHCMRTTRFLLFRVLPGDRIMWRPVDEELLRALDGMIPDGEMFG